MSRQVDEFEYPYKINWAEPDEDDFESRDTDIPPPPDYESSEHLIREECDLVCDMLLTKNLRYGDSFRSPERIFSKSDSREQLLVRIDDKLSRIRNQDIDEDEDALLDLTGYLILLMIVNKLEDQ